MLQWKRPSDTDDRSTDRSTGRSVGWSIGRLRKARFQIDIFDGFFAIMHAGEDENMLRAVWRECAYAVNARSVPPFLPRGQRRCTWNRNQPPPPPRPQYSSTD